MLTHLQNIPRRDKYRKEILNGLETPSASRSTIISLHAQSTGRRPGLNAVP